MRRLFYIPILHTAADLGTLAPGVEEHAIAVSGSSARQKQAEVVGLYWREIASYWQGQTVAGLKIFQDGMPVDGPVGAQIVKSLAQSGSINHLIIEHLLENGAILMKTEDPAPLKEEYFLTKELAQKKPLLGTVQALLRYRWRKGQLLRARDSYIIKRINEGLQEGDSGVCFLGAAHRVVPGLAKDIEVIALKDPAKVRRYFQKLTSRRREAEVNKLGYYLTAPIARQRGETYG
ncbi:MAG: hypothetical protein M3Z08_11595 [Chloroflexota bacterium]|nr:hypothetical protein [Chloroflexota bacterium]